MKQGRVRPLPHNAVDSRSVDVGTMRQYFDHRPAMRTLGRPIVSAWASKPLRPHRPRSHHSARKAASGRHGERAGSPPTPAKDSVRRTL